MNNKFFGLLKGSLTLMVILNITSVFAQPGNTPFSGGKLEYNPDDWELIFNDEFTDPSLSRLQSVYDLDGPRCTQRSLYSWDNVNVQNGNLVLTSTKLSAPQVDPACNSYTASNKMTPDYKGGGLVSKGSYTSQTNQCGWVEGFKYGMFEVRCKLPEEYGAWPAWWLYNGPDEIDIFEFEGDKPYELTTNFHDWCAWYRDLSGAGFIPNPSVDCSAAPAGTVKESCQKKHLFQRKLTEEFHTFTLVWTPNRYTMFIDGKEIRTETRFAESVCEQRFILNLGARNNATYTSSEFLVDYIRIYKQKNLGDNFMYTYDSETITQNENIYNSAKSMELGPNNDQLFFRDHSNWMNHYNFVNNAWVNDPLPQNSSSWQIDGDLVVGEGNQTFYRGVDGRIQSYYFTSNGWAHAWVDEFFNYETSKVSGNCGSMAVGEGNQIFYRGTDDFMHIFYWSANAGWQHGFLPIGPSSWEVDGDVVVGEGNQVFYRGKDERMQIYYYGSGSWHHGWVDDFQNTDDYKVSSGCGSIEVGTGNQLFYCGKDLKMHGFQYVNGDWEHFYLPNELSTQLCSGDISLGLENTVFYRGIDDQMQMYYYQGMGAGLEGHWFHAWVNEKYPLTSLEKVRPNSSIDVSTLGGVNQPFYSNWFTNPSIYKLRETSGEIVDLDCGYNVDPTYFKSAMTDDNTSEDISKASFNVSVYPNPAHENVTFELDEYSDEVTYSVYSGIGQKIANGVISERMHELDITNFEQGVYFIRFASNDGQLLKKLMIE